MKCLGSPIWSAYLFLCSCTELSLPKAWPHHLVQLPELIPPSEAELCLHHSWHTSPRHLFQRSTISVSNHLFVQFKPISFFPLHVGTRNRTSPPSASRFCRLLCPRPTTTEMLLAMTLLCLLWWACVFLEVWGSILKQILHLRLCQELKLEKTITMPFGNVYFYISQGSNCTFCSSTASTTPIQTVTPTIPESFPAALPSVSILLLLPCSLWHMPPLHCNTAFQIISPVFKGTEWLQKSPSCGARRGSQLWRMPLAAAAHSSRPCTGGSRQLPQGQCCHSHAQTPSTSATEGLRQHCLRGSARQSQALKTPDLPSS